MPPFGAITAFLSKNFNTRSTNILYAEQQTNIITTKESLIYMVSFNTNKKYTQKNVLSITHINKIIKE